MRWQVKLELLKTTDFYEYVCLRVSIAVLKKHDHNQLREERVYFSFWLACYTSLQRKSRRELKQSGNLKAGAVRGHEGMLLTGFPIMTNLAYLLITLRITTHQGWHLQ